MASDGEQINPLDLDRLLRWQCVAEGKSAKERDRLLSWFSEAKEGKQLSTIQKTSRWLLNNQGAFVDRQTLTYAFQISGGKMDPSNHMNPAAAHRYGHDVTEFPPYVKIDPNTFKLNPTVHAAVLLLNQEIQENFEKQMKQHYIVCQKFM